MMPMKARSWRFARELEHEVLGRGIDHLRAEDLGQPQRLDALFPAAANLDQRKLALHGVALERQIPNPVHRNEPLELMLDLLDHRRRPRCDDGDAADVLLVLGSVTVSHSML